VLSCNLDAAVPDSKHTHHSCSCARRSSSCWSAPTAQRLLRSGGQVRANAYQEAGWTPTWTLTEDFALGMEMKRNGWHCRYLNQYLAVGEVPLLCCAVLCCAVLRCAALCCTAVTFRSCLSTPLLSCVSAMMAREQLKKS
jgi:hypothetical protein